MPQTTEITPRSAGLRDQQIFVVFSHDGRRVLALAASEDDLPVNPANIAFAASLSELKDLVGEMEKAMSASIEDSGDRIVLRADKVLSTH